MGWSKSGLGKLSAARIYVKNGGRLSYKDFQSEEGEMGKGNYRDYAEQMISEVVGSASDWSIFTQAEPRTFDLASGTQQALHQIGIYRNILS